MNLAANDLAAPIGRIQAISLGQEILQRPTPWRKNLSERAIQAHQQSSWRSAMRSLALVVNPAIPIFATHSRSKIWQVKPRARDGNRQRVTSVQTEKPHAGLFAESHIGADIQFRECRPRARPAPQRCRFATAQGEADATRRRRPANAQIAGRARSAPSPRARWEEARAGARLLAGSRSSAYTKLCRQGHFLNIPLQEARESNSLDSNGTKEP